MYRPNRSFNVSLHSEGIFIYFALGVVHDAMHVILRILVYSETLEFVCFHFVCLCVSVSKGVGVHEGCA